MSGTARHIGVEAVKLLREKRGIGRYVRNLLRLLPAERDGLRFTLYTRLGDQSAVRAQLEAFDGAVSRACDIAPIAALPESRADVVWYPWNWLHPAARHAPTVVTVHDVAPMLQLDHRWWRVLNRAKFRRRYTHTVQRADRILTVSAFTASEVQRHLGVDASRLRVTRLAADDLMVRPNERSETLERLGVDGPFFLTVGAHDGRKNLGVLERAMTALHAAGETVPLVQCGPGARGGAGASWIRRAGYVSDAELATLYARATALIFPSRYEGFGLPVLEAMRAGGCVICADASSLPEVAGDAALRFPWHDATALAAGMTRLLHEPGLREELVERGLAHAAGFSWRKTARETIAVFDEVVRS